MDALKSPPQDPQVRFFFVACPRSGSALLMRIFAESPVCTVTSRLILMGNHGSPTSAFSPDYSILEDPINHHGKFINTMKTAKRFVICKEELGNGTKKGECPFGSSFAFATDREKSIYCEEKSLGLFTTIEASSSVETDVPCHNLLSNIEKDDLEKQVGRLYLECWHDDVQRLRAMLIEKSWFGFDLDDTLHEFRRSSGIATNRVLEKISVRHHTPMLSLKEEYSHILKEKTANAFSDGKTSYDYRRERFESLLAKFSLPKDNAFLTELLDSYESNLKASLETKCGVLDLLSTIKSMGKKIVIITEGPQDAQERTVKDLGIGGYVDFLATTNHFKVTKLDGLFPKVLEYLGISSGDMVYVGDNEQRDVKPATAVSILCIHLAETKNIALDALPPRTSTLRKLQYILSKEKVLEEASERLRYTNAAKKTPWMARRTTTRVEDMAYCLLDIFDINTPMLYGEGTHVFRRLQEEIMKKLDDSSLLAWNYTKTLAPHPECHTSLDNGPLGLSFSWFSFCGVVEQNFPSNRLHRPAFAMNQRGLQIRLSVFTDTNTRGIAYGVLACGPLDDCCQRTLPLHYFRNTILSGTVLVANISKRQYAQDNKYLVKFLDNAVMADICILGDGVEAETYFIPLESDAAVISGEDMGYVMDSLYPPLPATSLVNRHSSYLRTTVFQRLQVQLIHLSRDLSGFLLTHEYKIEEDHEAYPTFDLRGQVYKCSEKLTLEDAQYLVYGQDLPNPCILDRESAYPDLCVWSTHLQLAELMPDFLTPQTLYFNNV
ncbi:had-superfamily subfamily variant 1 [Seiridium cupressi]